MVPSNRRRVVLYLSASIALTGLVYGGFVYESPADAGMLISCANAQLTVGLHDDAEPFVEALLKQDPQSYEGLMLKACIHERRKEWGPAASLYRDLLVRTEDPPMRAELQLALARIQHECGDVDAALVTLDEVHPPGAEIRFKLHCLRSIVLFTKGDGEAAMKEYERADMMFPNAAILEQIRTNLGLPPENNSESAGGELERHNAVQVTPDEGR